VKITPIDIRRREFKRSVRGYVDEEVDAFLDAVANEFERLSQENADLQDRVQALEEQVAGHAHIREALEKTLVAAQLQSEEIRSKAQKESQSILRDAEGKAKNIVGELYSQTQKVQQTLMQLKLMEEDFRFKFRALLEGYLRLLDEGPVLLSGLETRLAESAGAGVEGVSRPSDEGPEGASNAAVSGGLGEDNPTLETEEVSALANGPDSRGGKKKGKAEGHASPQASATSTGKRIVDDTTEELTIETASPQTEVRADSGGQAPTGGKTSKDGTEGDGPFAEQPDDGADPFPGTGTIQPKVREFEW
jgi:cell division initiation protein